MDETKWNGQKLLDGTVSKRFQTGTDDGEYTAFTGDKAFERKVAESAKHARNRYLITFSPTDPTPGLHTIRVRTVQDYGARIVARANYWKDKEQ